MTQRARSEQYISQQADDTAQAVIKGAAKETACHRSMMPYAEGSCTAGANADRFDALQVRMLIGLIRKVTGVTISAFFKQKSGYKYSGREMEMPWHSRTGFGHDIRKYRMRSASLTKLWAKFSVKLDVPIHHCMHICGLSAAS